MKHESSVSFSSLSTAVSSNGHKMEVENTGEEAPGDVSRASQARESVAVEDQAEQPSQLEERNGK